MAEELPLIEPPPPQALSNNRPASATATAGRGWIVRMVVYLPVKPGPERQGERMGQYRKLARPPKVHRARIDACGSGGRIEGCGLSGPRAASRPSSLRERRRTPSS